jgi:histone acetyltransferase (RNA polymerase elongator complex component)
MIIPIFIPHLGCSNQCVFCNQRTITGMGESAPSILQARQEIDAWLERAPNNSTHEIAFYGGSFTALPLARQLQYLELAGQYKKQGAVHAIRLSTRPDAVEPEHLLRLKAYGVNRIELGAQSFDDRVLSMSMRGHTVRDIQIAGALIRGAGIELGLQLMIGLPGDSAETDARGILETVRLGASTLRIYPTLVLRGTILEKMYSESKYVPLTVDVAVARTAAMMDLLDSENERLKQAAMLNLGVVQSNSQVQLIRVGLQENEMLRTSGDVLAGPHHPAFRCLVDSYRFMKSMDQHPDRLAWRGCRLEVRLRPEVIGSFVGHQRSNLRHLRDEYGVRDVVFVQDPTLSFMQYSIHILQKNGRCFACT